jgi:fatty-acid desaturase
VKFLYIFLACYFISFVIAWLLAAKRMARMARILKNHGVPDNMIDEQYRNMSKPTWIMSIWFMLVTGTLLGIVVSIIYALAF